MAQSDFATEMVKATNDKGNEVRLMPYAELMQWKVNGDQVQGTLHGWQQVELKRLFIKS